MSTTDLAPVQTMADAHMPPDGCDLLHDAHASDGTHSAVGVVDPLPPANGLATPIGPAPGAPHSTTPIPDATPKGQPASSTLHQPPAHVADDTHTIRGGWLALRIWAEMFHDAQAARIAATNQAERGGTDPALYEAYLDSLTLSEKVAKKGMIGAYRTTVPAAVQAWVKASPGLAEHSMARLLGHLGHPRIATPHHWEGTGSKRTLIAGEPYERTISQLWQYCGHGAPGRATKGMSAADLAALGSPNLKMLVHLIAECCMKQKGSGSPYRLVYDDARQGYADQVHGVACVRCGPSGKPAQPGSPWSLGHQHAAALRKVGKEVLRDLWKVAS